MESVAAAGDVKVYNLSAGRSLPQWLAESRKRSIKKDDSYRRRIELIQVGGGNVGEKKGAGRSRSGLAL